MPLDDRDRTAKKSNLKIKPSKFTNRELSEELCGASRGDLGNPMGRSELRLQAYWKNVAEVHWGVSGGGRMKFA